MACILKIHISRKGYEIQNFKLLIGLRKCTVCTTDEFLISLLGILHHFKPNQSLRMLLSRVLELDDMELDDLPMVRKGLNDI